MRQAIQTKYLGPTNFRGSRVKASCQAKSIILAWDNALNSDRNHQRAASMLAHQMGWSGAWVGGALVGPGFVFVQDDHDGFTVSDKSGFVLR